MTTTTDLSAGLRRSLVLLAVMAGAFMAVIDVAIVNVALARIRSDLGAGYGEVELVVSAYTLVFACTLVTGGRLGDTRGRRRMYLLGLAVFVLGSAACGLAPSVGVLIGVRAAQALGAALLYPQVLAIITVVFPEEERVRPLSVFGAVIGLGAATGQLLGGGLLAADIAGTGWRAIFLVNVPLGVAVLALAARTLPRDHPDGGGRLDPGGVALATLALALLIVPLLTGRELGWPPWSLACLVLAPAVGAVFLRHERSEAARGGRPLVPLALFRHRGIRAGVPIAAMFTASYGGFLLLLAIHLQIGLRFSPIHAALTYLPNAVGFFAGTLLAPRLTRMLGSHALALGYAVAALGMLGVAATVASSGGALAGWEPAPALLIAGLGQGAGITPLIAMILADLEPAEAGAAAGVVTTAFQVGSATGVALLGLLFFLVTGDPAQSDSSPGFAAVLVVVALVLACAALLTRRLPRAAAPAPRDRLAGLVVSMFLVSGGRVGDRAVAAMVGAAIDRRAADSRAAPAALGELLAYHFETSRQARGWLGYLAREAHASGTRRVAREDERTAAIAAQVEDLAARQRSGDVPASLEPTLLRLAGFALASYPYLLPQITRMTTGHDPDDPAFVADWAAFLRALGALAQAGETAPDGAHGTHGGA